MNMFGLEGSGFVVAIAVTLLIAGAIVYYCNTRITAIEKAIVKQNQVLADFIGNVKQTLTNGQMYGSGAQQQAPVVANGATQEAVDAANDYYSNTTPEQKIEVSDDENDLSSDSESDSDSESESENENVNGNGSNETQEADVIELSDNTHEASENINFEVIGFTMVPPQGPPPPVIDGPEISEIEVEEIIEENKNGDVKTIKLGDVKTEEELELATGSTSELSSINTSEDEEDDGLTATSSVIENITIDGVNKMKVAGLRELAVKLKLGSEDSVKKIKKPVLQEMIKNEMNKPEE
jgi:hypothetical protein